MGPEKRINPERHAQGPIVPVSMVGVAILHIFYNFIFRQRPLSVAGNDIIQSQTVHHPFTVIADPAMGGMGYPLINVADGLVFHEI